MRSRPHLALVLLLPILFYAATTRAQDVGSAAILFEPSIEAAGMGGGGVSWFWRDEPNSWMNPALLGTQNGLRYSYGTTTYHPVPGEDIDLTSHRFSVGGWGVGLLFAGKPVGHDIKLDYGESDLTDIDGNVIATVNVFEEVQSFGIGVSVLDLLASIAPSSERLALMRRYVGISLGHTWKDILFEVEPELAGLAHGKAQQSDRGVAARLTPVDQIRGDLDQVADHVRWRVDLTGGYAELNYDADGDMTFYDGSGTSDPIYELQRGGVAARVSMALPSSLDGSIYNFITPTIRLGFHHEWSDYYDDGFPFDLAIRRWGGELVLADALYLRIGGVRDAVFGVDESTWGAGLALKYRKKVGVRFDYAHYPFSPFVPEEDQYLDRVGVTAFADLAALFLKRPVVWE